MNAKTLSLFVVASCAAALAGCQGCSSNSHGAETDTVTSTQITSSDSGPDTSTENGTASETEGTESHTSTAETVSGSEGTSATVTSDTATETGTGSDTDTDTWPLPEGCDVVTLSNAILWKGAPAIDGNLITWSEYNYDSAVPELRVMDLSTNKTTVLAADERWEYDPVVQGDYVFWSEMLEDVMTKEVWSMSLSTQSKRKLTDDSCADANALPGKDIVVYTKDCDNTEDTALRYTDLSTLESHEIVPDAIAPPGGAGMAFDGERYVVWSWKDSVLTDDHLKLFLYDIQNPGPPTIISPEGYGQHTPVIAQGKIFSATGSSSSMDAKRLEIAAYDLEKKTTTWIIERPYDQLPGDVAGHVLAYQNTEETGEGIFDNGGKSHVELKDLETGTVRKVTLVVDNYEGLALSGKYLVYRVWLGGNAGALVACDLKAAGFMGEDGHLLPD